MAGFKPTVLTRSASTIMGVSDGVPVYEVNYASEESLREALQGHDAVVSAVAGTAIASQKPLINASIAAGVKHFIPADYAMSLKSTEVRALPPYTDVKEIEDYLRARSADIEWTIVACGGFLEYIYDLPFLIELDKRKIDIINEGDIPFSVSEFRTAAKAVAGVLQQPERVFDHCVQVHAMTITQNGTFDIVRKYDPNPDDWTVNEEDAEVKFKQGMDMLQRGELTMAAVTTLMAGEIWGGRCKVAFEETDNEWLGVQLISHERLEKILKSKVTKVLAALLLTRLLAITDC